MATIVRATIPVTEFALNETLRIIPEATFEFERTVESGEGNVMPLIWVRDVEQEPLEAAFEADPSVDQFEQLAAFDGAFLYRMEWTEQFRVVPKLLTNTSATVLDASGDAECWSFRIMYPHRDELSQTSAFCDRYELTFDVERIHELSGDVGAEGGLTKEQFDALTVACEQGYFDVPRQVDLDDVADELSISHQALSERLRRGHEVLIEETLLTSVPPRSSLWP